VKPSTVSFQGPVFECYLGLEHMYVFLISSEHSIHCHNPANF